LVQPAKDVASNQRNQRKAEVQKIKAKSINNYAVAMERKAWSEPVAAGAISERGRLEVWIQDHILSSSLPGIITRAKGQITSDI
jgi:hypothetical protein